MSQSSANVLAALKREVTMGTPAAGGAGGYVLPVTDSPGLTLSRGEIASARRRRDQVRPLSRLGGKSVSGSYNTELLVGGAIDLLLESIARGTWSPALSPPPISISTPTTSTITRAADSFLTDGYRRGDIITLTGDTTAANNNLRLRVVSVTATTITVAGAPLTVNAVARPVTLTRLKKVIAPSSPVYHSYSIEQLDGDIDQSELFVGTRLTGLDLSLQPNAMAQATWNFQGLDRLILEEAQAPYYTSPSELNGLSLVADDSWIRYNGEDIVSLTGATLNFAINAGLQPTIGSTRSLDVYMNDLSVTGQITAIRESLEALQDFDAETEFELQFTLVEPGTDPKNVYNFFFPRVKVMGVDAQFLGGDTAKVETRNISIGPSAGSTDTDATTFVIHSSAGPVA